MTTPLPEAHSHARDQLVLVLRANGVEYYCYRCNALLSFSDTTPPTPELSASGRYYVDTDETPPDEYDGDRA